MNAVVGATGLVGGEVCRLLAEAGEPVACTVLQPSCFMEVWLSPALGFDPVRGAAMICGTGQNRVSWISGRDVARFAVAALMIYCARGDVVDMAQTLPAFGLAGLRTVHDHLRDILA